MKKLYGQPGGVSRRSVKDFTDKAQHLTDAYEKHTEQLKLIFGAVDDD
jgi:hypothetical protein